MAIGGLRGSMFTGEAQSLQLLARANQIKLCEAVDPHEEIDPEVEIDPPAPLRFVQMHRLTRDLDGHRFAGFVPRCLRFL